MPVFINSINLELRKKISLPLEKMEYQYIYIHTYSIFGNYIYIVTYALQREIPKSHTPVRYRTVPYRMKYYGKLLQ